MTRIFSVFLAAFAIATPALATGDAAADLASEPTILVKSAELTTEITACDPALDSACEAIQSDADFTSVSTQPNPKVPPAEIEG